MTPEAKREIRASYWMGALACLLIGFSVGVMCFAYRRPASASRSLLIWVNVVLILVNLWTLASQQRIRRIWRRF